MKFRRRFTLPIAASLVSLAFGLGAVPAQAGHPPAGPVRSGPQGAAPAHAAPLSAGPVRSAPLSAGPVQSAPLVVGSWTQAQVNAATTAGVAYIDSQCALNLDGHCGSSFPLSETGMALVAYSVEQAGLGGFNNMPAGHQAHVKAAIHYLLTNQFPDGHWTESGGFLVTYPTGIDLAGLSAFSAAVDPGIPAAITNGRHFLIDLDWQGPPRVTCSSAQLAVGNNYCGGWNYETNAFRSDESNTGYAMFGLRLTGGIPAAIQAVNIGWQNNIQELKPSNAQYAVRSDGGGSYIPGLGTHPFASNANDTGSMLFGYDYDGVPAADPRVVAGLKFGQDALDVYEKSLPSRSMVFHTGLVEDGSCSTSAAGCDWQVAGDGGYHYSLFSLTKGLGDYIAPVLADPNNWYAKVVDLLLTEQAANGSWPMDGRDDGTTLIATAFAVSALGLVAVITDQQISAAGINVSATEGVAFTGPVATITDPDANSMAAEYTASINWGDATTSAGTVSGPKGGSFTVTGTHTYAEEGSFKITVTITDVDTSNSATATSTATVADAALTGTCVVPATASIAFAGATATFTDKSTTGTLSDFTATISWGDGTSSAGVITGGPGTAPYTVSGTHAYAAPGFYTISTAISDVGGSKLTVTCPTQTFVIPPSTPGCDIDGSGKIKAANGDKAKFLVDFGSETGDNDEDSGNDEDSEGGDSEDGNGNNHELPENVQTYRDLGPLTPFSFVSTANLSGVCNGKTSGSIYGIGLVNGTTVVSFIIDVTTGNAEEEGDNDKEGHTAATYRIRLSSGYDSGVQKLKSGHISVHLESDEEESHDGDGRHGD